MQRPTPDHYAALGLDRRCTPAQIRFAYRLLAKQHHPDVNGGSRAALARTQQLNAAYETLSDPVLRAAYDRELAAPPKFPPSVGGKKIQRNCSQDVYLSLADLMRGTKRAVRLHDPANPSGAELYELIVPPETAPGTRFRLPRDASFGGFVMLRVKPQPDFRFKVRGSDLRCDLKIKAARAAQGGSEIIRGLTGALVRVAIPRGVGRNEVIRIPNEGLPRPRGGRGDLLVRIIYRVEIRIHRADK